MLALPPITITGADVDVALVPDGIAAAIEPGSIRAANESPYALQCSIGADLHWLQPWTIDVWPVRGTTLMHVHPVALAVPLPASPTSTLLVTVAAPTQTIPGVYPSALDRQSAAYGQRKQLWPDGTPLASQVGPSFTVAATVVTSFRVTLPAGTTGLRISPAITGGGTFVFSYQLRVTGHQSGAAYFPAPFVGIGTPTFPRQPVTVPVDVEYDTQIDIGITGDASLSLDFWVSALSAVEAVEVYAQQPFGVTSNVSGVTPAPWQAPNLPPIDVSTTIAAGGKSNPIAAVVNKTIYLFGLDFTLDALGAVASDLRFFDGDPSSGGIDRGRIGTNVQPPPISFAGAPLTLGNGFWLFNGGGAAITIRGTLLASQA